MEESVYRTKVKDVGGPRERILQAWIDLYRRIINTAVGERPNKDFGHVCKLQKNNFNSNCDFQTQV